jgi:hypothetical protein
MELLALQITANATDERIASATGLPKTRIINFFQGCRDLTIIDLMKIRQYLIDSIRHTITEQVNCNHSYN